MAARHRRHHDGFTLIELLVVIVILVALAAIAIPVFLNQKSNADAAADKTTVTSLAGFIAAGIADDSLAQAGGMLTSSTGTMATGGASITFDTAAGTYTVTKGGYTASEATGGAIAAAPGGGGHIGGGTSEVTTVLTGLTLLEETGGTWTFHIAAPSPYVELDDTITITGSAGGTLDGTYTVRSIYDEMTSVYTSRSDNFSAAIQIITDAAPSAPAGAYSTGLGTVTLHHYLYPSG